MIDEEARQRIAGLASGKWLLFIITMLLPVRLLHCYHEMICLFLRTYGPTYHIIGNAQKCPENAEKSND